MPIEAILAGLAAAGLGAVLARSSAPLACVWRGPAASLTRRVRQLARPAPSRLRRTLGGVFLAILLASGGLAAYAAAPDDLPKEAVGVVGSGDQLSLEVKTAPAAAVRTVKVGDDYKDGWKLQAVTPTKATLVKDGTVKEVGLNPSGVVAPPAPIGPPSQVTLAGAPDPATIDKFYAARLAKGMDGVTDGTMPDYERNVLSTEELKRFEAYTEMMDEDFHAQAGGVISSPAMLRNIDQTPARYRQVMGEGGYQDYQALNKRLNDAFAAAHPAPPQ